MADEIIIETVSAEVIEVGVPGPQGPAGAAGTGLETLTVQGDTLYRGASTGERLPIGAAGQVLKVVNGLPAWANESGAVSSVAGRTGAVTLAVADVSGAVSTSDARLSDSRTPSSTLAHSSTHHTGGTDAIAPNNISAAWAQALSTQAISGDTVLSAGRNRRIGVGSTSTITANITLPFSSNQAGDTITLVGASVGPPFTSTYTIRLAGAFDGGGNPVGYSNLATLNALGQSFTFVSDGTATGWSLRAVDTHTHPASAISDSTTAGRALLTGANAAAQRTSLGLGTAATSATGDFAAASHSHGNINSSGQVGSDSGRVLVTTTAGAVTTLALGTAGQVLRTKSDLSGVEFADPSGGGASINQAIAVGFVLN